MSKLILIFGSLLLITNTAVGSLLSDYHVFNWTSVNVVIIINTILLYKITNAQINDGFKVSLAFILPFFGIISIVLAIISPYEFKDNYFLIGFIFVMFFEILFYLIAKNLKTINTKR